MKNVIKNSIFVAVLLHSFIFLIGCSSLKRDETVEAVNALQEDKVKLGVDLLKESTLKAVINTVGNTNINIKNHGKAAAQGEIVCFSDGARLYVSDLNGDNTKELTRCNPVYPNINIVDDWIYFYVNKYDTASNEYTYSGIKKIRIDGTDEVEVVGLDSEAYTSMLVYNNWIYYLDKDGLYCITVNGQNKQLLCQINTHINTDMKKLYLIDNNEKILFYAYVTEFDEMGNYIYDLKSRNLYKADQEFDDCEFYEVIPIEEDLYIKMSLINAKLELCNRNGEIIRVLDTSYPEDKSGFTVILSQFSYYNGYIFFITINNSNGCSIVAQNIKTGDKADIYNITANHGLESGFDNAINFAEGNMFWEVKKELGEEIVQGTRVKHVSSELQRFTKDKVDMLIKIVEEKDK